ncbi:MAG: hypothetical protein HUU02_13495 [Bacteroidetes bacterium]|nr:hypothetical protein [Bacteroidota bacterium]
MNIFRQHHEFLKTEGDILLKNARLGDAHALLRLQQLPAFAAPDNTAPADTLQLKNALHVIALENGYPSWNELKAALDSAAESSPLAVPGEAFYPKGYTTYWNIWFAKYSQAKKVLDEGKGYLLPYKHQYFIVEEHFVDSIGIPHTMPEWEAIGRDWVHPRRVKEWLRLNSVYERAVDARREKG